MVGANEFYKWRQLNNMFHKSLWENALKLAKRRDEILEKNPDMPVAEALDLAYEEIKKERENGK